MFDYASIANVLKKNPEALAQFEQSGLHPGAPGGQQMPQQSAMGRGFGTAMDAMGAIPGFMQRMMQSGAFQGLGGPQAGGQQPGTFASMMGGGTPPVPAAGAMPHGLGGGLPQQAQGLGQQQPPMQQGIFGSMMGGGAPQRGDFSSMIGRFGPQMVQAMQSGRGQQMPQFNRQMDMANMMRQNQRGRMFAR